MSFGGGGGAGGSYGGLDEGRGGVHTYAFEV